MNYKIIVAYNENTSLGLVIFEIHENSTSSIALIVNPEYRNQGFGKSIISEFIKLYGDNTQVHAYIEKDNIPSIRCFEACGFISKGIDADEMIDFVYVFY